MERIVYANHDHDHDHGHQKNPNRGEVPYEGIDDNTIKRGHNNSIFITSIKEFVWEEGGTKVYYLCICM